MLRVRKYKRTAFSLTELSISIVIIALFLAAIASGSIAITKARLYAAASLTSSSPIVHMNNLVAWYETTSQNSFAKVSMNNQESVAIWHNLNPSIDPEDPNNASQETTTPDYQPKYSKDRINGLPAISFNGSNRYFEFDGTDLVLSDYTIFVVEQRSDPKDNNYFIGGDTEFTDNKLLVLGYKTNESILFSQFNNDYDFSVDSFVMHHAKIHVFRLSEPSSIKNYYYNGAEKKPPDTITGAISQLESYNYARIGKYADDHYQGDIGEIIIFNKALNNDEINDIEKYLGQKWRISLEGL